MTTNFLVAVAQVWISVGLGLWFFHLIANPPRHWHTISPNEPGWGHVLLVFPFLSIAVAPLIVYFFIRSKCRGQ